MKNLNKRKPIYIAKGFSSLEEYIAFTRKIKDVMTGHLLSTWRQYFQHEKTKESSNKRTNLHRPKVTG
jgi:hypothetical protein